MNKASPREAVAAVRGCVVGLRTPGISRLLQIVLETNCAVQLWDTQPVEPPSSGNEFVMLTNYQGQHFLC